MNAIAPGWYKDPAAPDTQRYWDGEGWLGDPLPADATPPDGPPPNAEPDWLPTPTQPGGQPGDQTDGPASGQPGRPAPDEPGPPPGQHQPGAAWPAPPPGQHQPGTAWPAPDGTGPPPVPWPPAGQPGQHPGQPGQHPGQPGPQPGPFSQPGAQPGPYGPPGTYPPGTYPPGWPGGLPVHPAYAQLFAPAPRPHGYPLADVGRRLVARLVDIGVLLVVNAVANGWFIYRFYQQFWPWYEQVRQNTDRHLPTDQIPQPENLDSLAFTVTLVAAALWFAYEVPSIATRGQTLGKRLLGIKVLKVEADGPIGYARSLRRWNLMGVATLLWTCGVGFFVQFVDSLMVAIDRPLHQALHDKSAATVVVDVKHGRAPVQPTRNLNQTQETRT